ncbi:MAG: site-2 protease family protein [Microthrixaceae bacterium]
MLSKFPALRFRLFGVPFAIRLSFVAAIVLPPLLLHLPIRRQPWIWALWGALVLISVMVHELGHVAALAAYGVRSRVSINALGGVTVPERADPLTPWRRIVVSAAGPAAAMLFGVTVAAGLVPIGGETAHLTLRTVLLLNIWVSLFNLVPILPLDGGHIASDLVRLASRRRGAFAWWVLVGFAALFAATWWALPRYRLWVLTVAAISATTNLSFFAFTRRQLVRQSIEDAHEDLGEGRLVDGLAVLMPTIWSADTDLVGNEAYTLAAWALLHERRFAELAAMNPARLHPRHQPLLAGATQWYHGDLALAVDTVALALAGDGVDPPTTYFSRVFGRIGEVERLSQRVALLPADQRARATDRLHHAVLASRAEARPALVG